MQVIKCKKNIEFKDINNNLIVIIDNQKVNGQGLSTIKEGLGYNYHEGVKVYPTPNKFVGKVTLLLNPILISFEDNSKGIPLNKCLIGYYKINGITYGLIDTIQKAYVHNTRLSWSRLDGQLRLQPNTSIEKYKDKRLYYNKNFKTSNLLEYINTL